MTAEPRKATPRARTETISLSLHANRPRPDEDTYLIGVAVSDRKSVRYHTLIRQGERTDVLNSALEDTLLRVPALQDISLHTPHKEIWQPQTWTPRVRGRLSDRNVRMTARRPNDSLADVIARQAAYGESGPALVDHHLYTATLTDEDHTYTSAILFARGQLHVWTNVMNGRDLLTAETTAVKWAFGLMPESSVVMIENQTSAIRDVWEHPERAARDPELKAALVSVGKLLRIRGHKFKQRAEAARPYLQKCARDIAGRTYAGR